MKSYLTTPIYYVNDRPHIGHAYTTILTDAVARWHRLMGRETFFLTGTDEHGQKVQQAAEKRGCAPLVHCDEMHQAFRNLWPELHIDISRFIRTTEPGHMEVVQGTLQQLFDAGLIYAKNYGGWYSVSEERFWTEKDLVDGRCPLSGNPVEWIEEKNYFFRMSQYQDELVQYIEANPAFIRPSFRRNEVLGFLRQPLEDLCISRPRSRLNWGIELPFDSDYVTYVWFDALLNYLTGIGYPKSPDWQTWWSESTHLIGKDIITTHCVYWTTMLLAMGLPLPKGFVAHGWWLMDNSKMSKTKGNVVDPMALKDRYGVEVFRYFLLREMSVGQDASFSEENLVIRNNTELANDLGNLVNRTLHLIEKRFDGQVPSYQSPDPSEDEHMQRAIEALPTLVQEYVAEYQIHRAIDACMSVVRLANKYLNDTAPFRRVKTDPERAGSTLHQVLRALHVAAEWLAPALPETMCELKRRIGVVDGVLSPGNPVHKGMPLFPKYEFQAKDETSAVTSPEKTSKAKAPAPTTETEWVSFEDFSRLDLRVGTVLQAEPVEGASKLLKLSVDLGTETRQVVAGLAKSYSAEELQGSQVVVVANLKPRTIFGLESQGMVLAARKRKKLIIVTPQTEIKAGAEVS